MRIRVFAVAAALGALSATTLFAQDLTVSLGIRETGGTGPAFADAGASGGIEWVNLDGQALALDGTWQRFVFTPSVDTLTAFAGATADGVLDGEWASIEHIRLLNGDGITDPIRLWIDDVANTDSAGTVTESFETHSVGDEVIFQEPTFSGSTSGNLAPAPAPDSSLVSDSMANTGVNSLQVDLQYVDDSPTGWVRLTTFSTPNLPNPAIHVAETAFSPTVSFWAKGMVVPEPTAIMLMAVAGMGLLLVRRRG